MRSPEIPADDASRLESLTRLQILDTPKEARFDRITRLARASLGTEIALVSLVDQRRQWFKSSDGLATQETSREISFCGHAILQAETFVVRDTREDVRFADNPLVLGEPHIRFYAGHPVRAPDGARIGTLCVIDSSPKSPTTEQLKLLEDLALTVEQELHLEAMSQAESELRTQLKDAERRAAVDSLTRVWNRGAITQLLENELARAERTGQPLGVILLDLDHFKTINDTYGHAAGDAVLVHVAEGLRACLRGSDSVGRYGGEEFLVVLTDCSVESAKMVAERIRQYLASHPVHYEDQALSVTASLGLCVLNSGDRLTPQTLIAAADSSLYLAKKSGRNRTEFQTLPPLAPGVP